MPGIFMTPPHRPSPDQQRVDEIQSEARRDEARSRLFVPRPASSLPLAPTEDQISARIAEEIDHARRILDALGDKLSGDVAVLQRHGKSLQAFDVIGQLLGHLSSVVGAADREAAIERIGMAELKTRLTRVPLTATPTSPATGSIADRREGPNDRRG
jgi:hypothetical protein